VNATTPVERVANLLVSVGYRRISVPLSVADLKFSFAAVFLGTGTSPDLIIVADTAFESETRIQQQVEGLARALDMMRSRRPLTIIITGPRPRSSTLDALSRVSRVLPVEDAAHDAILKDSLAVLLPLNLPEPKEAVLDVNDALTRPIPHDPIVDIFLAAARTGEDEVRERLYAVIGEPFHETEGDLEGNL
jgi:hypothetical protein